jgi:hypothetical protein
MRPLVGFFVVIYFSIEDVRGREMKMKNWLLLLLTLIAFGISSSGCAEYAQNVKDKCPECGTIPRQVIEYRSPRGGY